MKSPELIYCIIPKYTSKEENSAVRRLYCIIPKYTSKEENSTVRRLTNVTESSMLISKLENTSCSFLGFLRTLL